MNNGTSQTAAPPTRLAPAVAAMADSPTSVLESRVAQLHRAGARLLRLGMGEPDFGPPAHVRAAVVRAAQEGASGYTETGGGAELRKAIAARLTGRGLAYEAGEVMATNGAKQAIFQSLAALCGPGDEVLLPLPYWVSFPEQIRFLGSIPVFVKASAENGCVAPNDLRRHLGPRTRVLILNSPNNPSGAVYGRRELEELAVFSLEHDLSVISDEVYSAFVPAPRDHISIAALPQMKQRTVVVDSVSKTYGIPGWRLGYAAASHQLIAALIRIQSHFTSNPSSLAQAAAEAALTGPQGEVEHHRLVYERRMRLLTDGARGLPGMSIAIEPAGGFFAWLDASRLLPSVVAGRQLEDADALATFILEKTGVVTTPGTGFGSARHLRFSVAAPEEEIREGLSRLAELLSAISREV